MARDLAQTPIYHITDASNLPGIIAGGGLVSEAALAAKGGPKVVIGYDHIKLRRMEQTRIPHANNRFVGEFVPFYYCPRSPMLYVVNRGRTGRQPGCQTEIVHLVSTVANGIALGRQWAISDVNAGSNYPSFFNHPNALDSLDWQAIGSQYWQNCATQKAAEFLVADAFPWQQIVAIGCHNQTVAQRVTAALAASSHKPRVLLRPAWYY